MEPVGIRTDEVILRPRWPSGTDVVRRPLHDPMIRLRPGVSGGTGERAAEPVPLDLVGHEIARFVRRQATGVGPTPATGPVTLRPPGGRDIVAQVAAHRDLDVVRWYGVVADGVAG